MDRQRWSVGDWTLFGVGFLAAACLWLGLAWIPRRLAAVDALRAFAAARGARVHGDGVQAPLSILGVARGRPFTVTWQRAPGAGDLLLIGVDCRVEDGTPLDASTGEAAPGAVETAAEGAALVSRWVRPGPDVLDPTRLDAIVDALARMAEELEASSPDAEPDPD